MSRSTWIHRPSNASAPLPPAGSGPSRRGVRLLIWLHVIGSVGCSAGGSALTDSGSRADSAATRVPVDIGDGPGGCAWVYAFGLIDEFTPWVLNVPFPTVDYEADIDVSYTHPLLPGELVYWHSGEGNDEASIHTCTDWEASVVGARVETTGGTLVVEATALGETGATCGQTEHLYDATLQFFGVAAEGEALEMPSLSFIIGDVVC